MALPHSHKRNTHIPRQTENDHTLRFTRSRHSGATRRRHILQRRQRRRTHSGCNPDTATQTTHGLQHEILRGYKLRRDVSNIRHKHRIIEDIVPHSNKEDRRIFELSDNLSIDDILDKLVSINPAILDQYPVLLREYNKDGSKKVLPKLS